MKRGLDNTMGGGGMGGGPKRQRAENPPCRTIYLGSLPPNTTLADICDLTHEGILDCVRHLPHKQCGFLAFADEGAAMECHNALNATGATLYGKDITVGYGTASPIPETVAAALAAGATRNLFVGGRAVHSEQSLFEQMCSFGPVDCVEVLAQKKIAFVHFGSVQSAVTAKETLSADPKWSGYRFNFGKDRCSPESKRKFKGDSKNQGRGGSKPAMLPGIGDFGGNMGGMAPGMGGMGGMPPGPMPSMPPAYGAYGGYGGGYDEGSQRGGGGGGGGDFGGGYGGMGGGMYEAPFDPRNDMGGQMGGHMGVHMGGRAPPRDMGANAGNRTIWLGGYTEEITLRDILDSCRGVGAIDQAKILPEKKCCFLSFVDAHDAMQFHNMFPMGLTVKTLKLKVGWGKSRALPSEIARAVAEGASRSLFIGNIDESITAEKLQSDFASFGIVEKADVVHQKKIAFAHFTTITAAMACKAELTTEGTALNDMYGRFRVNFSKDRCCVRPGGGKGGGRGGHQAAPHQQQAQHQAPPPVANFGGAGAPLLYNNDYAPPTQGGY